ncbi:MAG TPA: putative motility protein [Methylophaga sp.]|nr:putative motility protein [Methylophaga sp.]
MNSISIMQLASALNQQQIAEQQQIQMLKLVNEQMATQGTMLVEMLNSVPAATANSGNVINIKV